MWWKTLADADGFSILRTEEQSKPLSFLLLYVVVPWMDEILRICIVYRWRRMLKALEAASG